MKNNKLILKQLDAKFKRFSDSEAMLTPKEGWIRTIRKALGITTAQLAKKLNVNRSRIIKIESDESRQALTIRTLVATANALNCDFVYALVPRKPLQAILEEQAYKVASQHVDKISRNMLLENQGLSPEKNQEQIKELQKKLVEKAPKNLWDEE